MTESLQNTTASAAAEHDWSKVVGDFHRLCLSKLRGDRGQYQRLLTQELPARIAAWSRGNTDDPARQKAGLETMFKTVQAQLESIPDTRETPAPAPRPSPLSPLPAGLVVAPRSVYERARSLPLEDVPGVVDFLQGEEERDARATETAA